MNLEIIVRGHPIKVRVKRSEYAQHVMRVAIWTRNEPVDRDWDFTCNGRLLDPRKSIGEQGVEEGMQLFLSFHPGVAA